MNEIKELDIQSSRRRLEDGIGMLCLFVSDYCTKQKETWQLVPNLALEADGLSCWSDTYRSAYMHGMWKLGIRGYKFEPCVDLETGELVWYSHQQSTFVPLPNNNLLDIAKNIQQINASRVVNNLMEHINCGLQDYMPYTKESLERWKSEVRKTLGLGEYYSRPEFVDIVEITKAETLLKRK